VIGQTAADRTAVRLPAVEQALLRSDLVTDCVVCARQTCDRGVLTVGYVVSRPHVPFSSEELRAFAVRSLPPGQVPDWFVELRSIPLTPDGDVDLRRLLDIEVADERVQREWEKYLRAIDGVEDAAVVLEDAGSHRRVLHLSDLVPGWSTTERAHDAAAVADAPSESAARLGERPTAFADGGALEIPADAPRTLTAGLLATAAARGWRSIRFVDADGSEATLTYAQLLHSARRILGGLRRSGLRAGDVAILQLPDLADHFPVFWACLLGGIKPLTVAVPSSYDANNAVVRKLANAWRLLERPPIVAATRLVAAIEALVRTAAMDGLRVLAVDDLPASSPAEGFHTPAPHDVAFFQLSSGSTGVSKCIQVTHRGVVAHIHASQQFLGLSPDDVTLNWLPMDHVVPLLMYHVKDTYLGIEQVQVPGPVVLGDPLKWLDYIARYRVTHTWSPNFGFKMLGDALAGARDRVWDLSTLKAFLNAGEQVTLPVVSDLLDRVAPFGVAAHVMQPAFGMAEVCTCMTYERFDFGTSVHRLAKASISGALRPAAGAEAAVTFVDCGPPMRGVQIRIADRANAVLPEGTIGRLQIKGDIVTPGYLHNPEANAEAMVGDGWFNTGDLGFIWNGKLTISGREKELIIVNGANYYCYEIEDAVSEISGVLATFIAACGVDDPATGTEALALFFVHDETAQPNLIDVVRTIRSEVAARVGLSPAYVVPIARDEFPKTTSGKIQRGQLKRWLLDGRFADTLRRLDIGLENANTVPDWFYRPTWRVKRLSSSTGGRAAAATQLLFLDEEGLGVRVQRALLEMGRRCITIRPGAAFRRVADDQYEVRPDGTDDYLRLLAESDVGPAPDVLHFWTYGGVAADAPLREADGRALECGVFSLLGLTQALARRQSDRPVRLTVVSSRASAVAPGDAIVAERAALTGLLKSIPSELNGVVCRHVDLGIDAVEEHARAVLDEHFALTGDAEVAHRDRQRWVRRIERASLSDGPLAPPPFVDEGLYLLTGGLGGIGTEIARYLLSRHGATLLIVGRAPVDSAACREAVRALDGPRGSVRYQQVDLADSDRLRDAVIAVEQECGRTLNGVIHLAGVFAERPVIEETPESFAVTLLPKVQGTYAAHAVATARPGTLFVTFSSAYGVFGGFAASAYATANAFLDAFVVWQRSHGLHRAYCLAWSLWDDTGMSRGFRVSEAARARGFQLIPRRQGINSLVCALHRSDPHLLIGVDEDGATVRSLFEVERPEMRALTAYCIGDVSAPGVLESADVEDSFGRRTACRITSVPALPRGADGSLDRRAVSALARGARVQRLSPRNDLERIVARIWQEALKQDGVGVDDNFFELGGTSFLAGQIAGRIREALKADVISTQMFQFPTIAAQARFLQGESGAEWVAAGQSRGAARRDAARRGRSMRRAVDRA